LCVEFTKNEMRINDHCLFIESCVDCGPHKLSLDQNSLKLAPNYIVGPTAVNYSCALKPEAMAFTNIHFLIYIQTYILSIIFSFKHTFIQLNYETKTLKLTQKIR